MEIFQPKTQPNVLKVCLQTRRNTGSLGVEVSLATGVSASVLLCAQLVTGWKTQLYAKLFAIVIQMVTFQSVAANDALASAARMPKICKCFACYPINL